MKYGAHIFLWVERWSPGALGLFDRARGLGLDCVEIAVGDDVDFDAKAVRARAGAAGVEVVLSPGAEWPMECDISHDDAACRRRGIAWHRRWIAAAAEAGAVAYTGAIYGHPGRVLRRRPDPDEFRRAADGLRELAEHGAGLGVRLVIEPMSHFRTHLVNTPAQAMDLVRAAGHANLSILFDTYHAVTELRDYAGAARAARPRLWGLHACENDRGVPGGGLVPWKALFAALGEAGFDDLSACNAQAGRGFGERGFGERGFDGYVILETYNSSLGDFAFSRGMFHNVCPDGDAFVREGLRFLKGLRTG